MEEGGFHANTVVDYYHTDCNGARRMRQPAGGDGGFEADDESA
jgi:hypothetical protein